MPDTANPNAALLEELGAAANTAARAAAILNKSETERQHLTKVLSTVIDVLEEREPAKPLPQHPAIDAAERVVGQMREAIWARRSEKVRADRAEAAATKMSSAVAEVTEEIRLALRREGFIPMVVEGSAVAVIICLTHGVSVLVIVDDRVARMYLILPGSPNVPELAVGVQTARSARSFAIDGAVSKIAQAVARPLLAPVLR